jgi:hypothetical protein
MAAPVLSPLAQLTWVAQEPDAPFFDSNLGVVPWQSDSKGNIDDAGRVLQFTSGSGPVTAASSFAFALPNGSGGQQQSSSEYTGLLGLKVHMRWRVGGSACFGACRTTDDGPLIDGIDDETGVAVARRILTNFVTAGAWMRSGDGRVILETETRNEKEPLMEFGALVEVALVYLPDEHTKNASGCSGTLLVHPVGGPECVVATGLPDGCVIFASTNNQGQLAVEDFEFGRPALTKSAAKR